MRTPIQSENNGNQPVRFVFPQWSNALLPMAIGTMLIAPVYVAFVLSYGLSPVTNNIGYMPNQPIPFSHKVHAGELGLDCRYCHNTVEHAAKAAIPPTQTCMTCHAQVQTQSELLRPLWDSYSEGTAIQWQRVHDLPDYVYFNHSAHVERGVGCASCHGRIDQMDVVFQAESLSMGWCLACHRDPEPSIRPLDQVINLAFDPVGDQTDQARRALLDISRIAPSEDCSTCHR